MSGMATWRRTGDPPIDCDYQHPKFGACQDGWVYGSIWDEETGETVYVDYACPRCNGGRTLLDPRGSRATG